MFSLLSLKCHSYVTVKRNSEDFFTYSFPQRGTRPFSKISFSLFVIVLYCSPNKFSNNGHIMTKNSIKISFKSSLFTKVQMCFLEFRSCFLFIVLCFLYSSKSICFVTRKKIQSVSFCMQDIRGLSVSAL